MEPYAKDVLFLVETHVQKFPFYFYLGTQTGIKSQLTSGHLQKRDCTVYNYNVTMDNVLKKYVNVKHRGSEDEQPSIPHSLIQACDWSIFTNPSLPLFYKDRAQKPLF